jgi:uncharacterized OsmC-like protein
MKKIIILLSIFVFCGVFVYGNALAANPDKIKVGILLPLTGTFAAVAAMEGVTLKKLIVAAENKVDLSRSVGLSNNPIVEQVEITVTVQADAPKEKLAEIERLAHERCPGVYCLTNPIPLRTQLVVE